MSYLCTFVENIDLAAGGGGGGGGGGFSGVDGSFTRDLYFQKPDK